MGTASLGAPSSSADTALGTERTLEMDTSGVSIGLDFLLNSHVLIVRPFLTSFK